MKEGTVSFSIIALVLWTATGGFVCAQSARVAVAGDPSLADLVDVTTGELSKLPELSVLDRADLDKLGREQEIQAALSSQDFNQLQILPADGLVLLRSVTNNGKRGVFARLVAVQPGVVLREVALPEGADPLTQAQALEKEFAPYWPKLAALQKGKITALSLLGLRFDVDSPETREMERSMNLLLANRLSAEPEVVVLERWRLNDAVFEKSLTTQQPSAFWTGSGLTDGGMQLKDGVIKATLRLRPAHGSEISISDQDKPENLAALAGRLADKIRNQPTSTTAWNPLAEATHYAELGKWGLDNRLYEEGTQALESALALGDNSRMTHMLQVKAYAMQAYPDDMHVVNADYNKVDVTITPDSLPQRVAAAARAASLARDYLKANHEFSTPNWDLEDPFRLCVPLLNNCLRTLRAAYENGFQQDHENEVAEARHEIQKLVAAMEDFVHEKSPDEASWFLLNRIKYAGLWHEKPEDTLAFYRDLMNSKTDGNQMRSEIFVQGMAPPYLDGEGAAALTAPWSIQSPWIVAWDGRSPDDLKTIWRNFVKELAASPDPVQQADSLKFEFYSNRTKAGRDEVATRIVAFLKQHQENIYGPRGEDFFCGFSGTLGRAGANSTNGSDLLDLYTTLFKQHVVLPPSWIFATSVIVDSKEPTDTVKNLLSALNDYTQWYGSQTPQDGQILEALARSQQTIYREKPELVPGSTPATDALPVPQVCSTQVNSRTLICAENNLWFAAPPKICCLDTTTWQITSTETVPAQFEPPKHSLLEMRARYIAVTPQWIVFAYAGQVLLCSRSDHQWHALDLPPSTYKPRWVNNELYLLYEAEYGAVLQRLYSNGAASIGSGLIHISLPDGKIENLISSRRIPPQNALDGKLLGQPGDLWMSQYGLTLSIDGGMPHFQVYTSPVGKSDWTSVITDPMPCEVRTTADGAVIGHAFSLRSFKEITFMGKNGDEVLLANPDQVDATGPVTPVWSFPDELRNTQPGERSVTAFAMRGDDLCLSHTTLGDAGAVNHSGKGTLYYFVRGQKKGIKIPLAFDVSQVKNPNSVAIGGLFVTDKDAIFGSSQGFWAIAWSAIDAYRAKAGAGTKPSAASTSSN